MKEYVEINCGLAGIRKMVMDQYDSLLFAIGYDNAISIIDLQDKEFKLKKEQEMDGINLLEEYLYDEANLKKKINEIEQLNKKAANFEKQNELKIKRDNENREYKIQDLQD